MEIFFIRKQGIFGAKIYWNVDGQCWSKDKLIIFLYSMD